MSGFTAPSVLGLGVSAAGARVTSGAPEAVLAATGVAFGAYLILGLTLLMIGVILRHIGTSGVTE